jgi:hypothetical protein
MVGISPRFVRDGFLALLFPICALTFANVAEAQSFPFAGKLGDHQHPDKCTGSDFLVGFSVRSGDWLDAIGIICAPINPDGTTGVNWDGPLRGSLTTGSAPQNVTCGSGFVVVGATFLFTSDNNRVRRIAFHCMQVRSRDQTIKVLGGIGDTNIPQLCNPGNAVTEVIINWGSAVNGVGIVCTPIPKIVLPPAPNPLVTALIQDGQKLLGVCVKHDLTTQPTPCPSPANSAHDGDSAYFVQVAVKNAGARAPFFDPRPRERNYDWGTKIVPTSLANDIEPGDILQLWQVRLRTAQSVQNDWGTGTSSDPIGDPAHHTALVVAKVGNMATVLEQDHAGVRLVQQHTYDYSLQFTGEVFIYRVVKP